MSEMYTPENTVLAMKGHQQRSCAVCQKPIKDEKAVPVNIGGGLELLVHRACMNEIMTELEPKTVVVPVLTSKQAISQPVRKSVVKPNTFDDKIRQELYRLVAPYADKNGNINIEY